VNELREILTLFEAIGSGVVALARNQTRSLMRPDGLDLWIPTIFLDFEAGIEPLFPEAKCKNS
jgi:hypothetical protein